MTYRDPMTDADWRLWREHADYIKRAPWRKTRRGKPE